MMIRKHIQMKFNLNDSKGLMYIIIKCKHKHFFFGDFNAVHRSNCKEKNKENFIVNNNFSIA